MKKEYYSFRSAKKISYKTVHKKLNGSDLMVNDIRVLIEKAVIIANKRKEIYQTLNESLDEISMRFLMSVLISQVEKDINFYLQVIESIGDDFSEELGEETYSYVEKGINDFNILYENISLTGIEELFKFALDIEVKLLDLFVNIQSRLVQNNKLSQTQTYLILGNVIRNKENNIKDLKYLMMENLSKKS